MRKGVAAILLIGILAFLTAAQSPSSQDNLDVQKKNEPAVETSNSRTIKVTSDLVNVLFTVFDKKNRMVVDLTKDDVRVVEDNKPQSIRFFSRESDLPLRIGILIDTSNSIRERLHFEQ